MPQFPHQELKARWREIPGMGVDVFRARQIVLVAKPGMRERGAQVYFRHVRTGHPTADARDIDRVSHRVKQHFRRVPLGFATVHPQHLSQRRWASEKIELIPQVGHR